MVAFYFIVALQLDQAGPQASRDSLCPAGSLKLSQNRANMEFDRVLRNVQTVGNFAIHETLGK
jgi:hypothetical protein